MIKKYTYYLFDLDRTLWDFDKNAKSAIFKLVDLLDLKNLFGVCCKELFFERYEVINHKLWDEYGKGIITKDFLRENRFYLTLKNYINGTYPLANECNSTNLPAQQWKDEKIKDFSNKMGDLYLEYMISETSLEPYAEEVLKRIKANNGKIAIISNGFKEVQYRKLRNSNIIHYMDSIIISEEVGVHKPSPIIFKKALISICGEENYNKNPQAVKDQTLMVGDDFPNDIEGAQVFGIDQFYYNPKNKECDGGPTYMSSSLLDVYPL
jgi:haloacid dehalogenase superfamily, subfamily IA, variant 1 with third motif having Dx(3-4)D or Dx(3-4)E